uniref:BEL1-like homeodomain protein 7 n=1 Tax=Actinidia chinensis TaxID=3625 RepID=A0A646TN75_ACTCH|nr:BEL1-like homeodomain protein 7 [Actinidia chinensis]
MQIVVSSFDVVAGHGAAKPYTTLALKTISRHFRSLHDAISSQIRVTQKNLGEQDSTPSVQGGLPRLRYVGQQLGQQRALLQQFGVMRHSWRPQRGLPESSVSVLRAWLFEHFLHPYPKVSEKTMLARKAGLTRSQVANWFINARVRLWKPMVEEMYKEEFGEIDFKSSPEHAPEEARDKSWTSEDTGEAADDGQIGQFDDSKSDLIPDFGMQGFTARLGFQNAACGDNKLGSGMTKLQDDQRPNTDNHDVSPDGIFPLDQTGDGNSNFSELGSFSVGKQVSPALGFQHFEKDSLFVSGGVQFSGDLTVASSMSHDSSD